MKLSLWNRKLSVADMKLSLWNRKLSVTGQKAFGHRTENSYKKAESESF
jgi:hypothetical protein